MSLPDSVPVPEPEPESNSVECRLEHSHRAVMCIALLGAAFYVALSFSALHDNRKGSFTSESERVAAAALFGLVSLLCVCFAAWLVLRIRRGFIIGDSDGLRWREAGRVRQARWEDVRDYYFKHVSSSSNRPTYVVETSAGRLSFGSEWSSDRELALFIECHASSTSGGWRERKRLEPRLEWSLRLSYRTFDNLYLMPALSLVCLGCLAAVDFSLLSAIRNPGANGNSLSQIVNLYGWPFTLLLCVIPGLLFLAAPAGCGVFFFRVWLDAQQRKYHLIEARPEGIAWTDGSRAVVSTWDEVRRIEMLREGHLSQTRHVIQTDKGEFDFLPSLSRSMLLLSLIRERAHNIPAEDWEPRSPSRQGSIQDGEGLLFGYRNASARFLAWCVTALLLLPLAMMWLRSVNAHADPDFLKGGAPWPLAAIGVALAAAVWRLLWTAGIRTDERGITQAGTLGPKFVAWPDVRKYLQTDSGFVIEAESPGGKRATIRFLGCISGADELLDEIQRRATRSRNLQWRHKLPPVGAETGEREPSRKYL